MGDTIIRRLIGRESGFVCDLQGLIGNIYITGDILRFNYIRKSVISLKGVDRNRFT